jgi:microcystin-dependent protein
MADNKDKKTTIAKTIKSTGKAKKTVAVKATATQLKDVKATSLPTAAALKERFKAGAIPLQTDFAHLIDMANIGRQGVGETETGWGLKKDDGGRLFWNMDCMFNTHYELSCYGKNDRVRMSNRWADENVKHDKIAILALNEDSGPSVAVKNLDGDHTLFNVNAIQIDSTGKKSNIAVKIKARKSVGETADFVPFEYVENKTDSWSLWYQFELDTSEHDFTDSILSIEPLMLLISEVKDFSGDLAGEFRGLMVVNFTYASTQQVIPKGLISMFAGDSAPAGWALCDGENETPDLRDRFILGGGFMYVNGKSDLTLSGDKNAKKLIVETSAETVDIEGKTKGHALTDIENGRHNHFVGIAVSPKDKAIYSGRTIDKSADWIGGSDSKKTGTWEPVSDESGEGEEHSHDIKMTSGSHSHTNEITVPYYILAFIMKL